MRSILEVSDPDLLSVARRELLEETGLACNVLLDGEIVDIDINTIPATSSVSEHLHYDVRFLFYCEPESSFVMNDESAGMEWQSMDAIVDASSEYEPSLKKLVRKALVRQNYAKGSGTGYDKIIRNS